MNVGATATRARVCPKVCASRDCQNVTCRLIPCVDKVIEWAASPCLLRVINRTNA